MSLELIEKMSNIIMIYMELM